MTTTINAHGSRSTVDRPVLRPISPARRGRQHFVGAAMAWLAFTLALGPAAVFATDYVYWTDRNVTPAGFESSIRRVKLDGTGIETILQHFGSDYTSLIVGLALDVPNGHLYTGDGHYLFRMNLDGTAPVNLVAAINPVLSIRLDPIHGKVYWVEGAHGNNSIRSANLDGSNPQTLIDVGFNGAFSIALDPSSKLYFFLGVNSGSDTIQSMNLDGSGTTLIYDLGGPDFDSDDMEIDLGRGRLYQTGFGLDGIYQTSVDGSIPYGLLLSAPDGANSGICYDLVDDKMYFFNAAATAINVMKLDGTGYSVLVQGIPLGERIRIGRGIVSGQPPTINCPQDIVTAMDNGACSAVVSFAATADGDSPSVVCSPASGSTFPKGTSTVNCIATDASGRTTSCSFLVTVQDVQPPTISCPANISVGCDLNAVVPVTFSVTASDNCDPAPAVTSSVSSGAGFPVGTTTVNCSARDGDGNAALCSFTVTRAPLGFDGFLPPIGGADATGGSFSSPVKTFKMGSVIPVKFNATCGNSSISSGVHTLHVIKWTDQTDSTPPIDATPNDAATTGNQFRFTGDEWIFNLNTKSTGMSVGKWQFLATLSDGSQHSVWVQLR